MSTNTTPKFRALLGLGRMQDGDVVQLLEASLKGLSTNAAVFPKPPVDLTTYQAAIAAYEAALPAALDGSKTAIAQKNHLKEAVVKQYGLLGKYVEVTAADMPTFLLSGFKPAATSKAAPQPVAVPSFAALTQGPNSGQMKVRTGTVAQAFSYEVRYGAVPPGGGPPALYTLVPITDKKSTVISGLTPGTQYTFQIRALGRMGYSDWSDPANRIAL